MNVPKYERQVNRNALQVSSPPAAAFGGQVYEANQQLGNTVSDVGALVQKRIQERQEEKDTQAIIDTETAYRKELDDYLSNKEKGLLSTRLLNNADGITAQYDTDIEKIKQKYVATLKSERQKTTFGQMADRYSQANREAVVRHEAGETRKGKENSLADSHNQAIAKIAQDPTLLTTLLVDADAKDDVVLRQLKLDDETIKIKKNERKGLFVSAAATAYLQRNDVESAKKIMTDYKDSINAENTLRFNSAIYEQSEKIAEEKIKTIAADAGNVQKPEEFEKLIKSAETVVKQRAIPDEAKENELRTAKDVMITNRIRTQILVEKDPTAAKATLDKHKSEMSGDKAAELEAMIQKESFTGNMQTLFTTYKTYKLPDGSIDAGRVYKDLEKRYKGDELERAKTAIEGMIADHERVRDQGRNSYVTTAQNRIADIKMNGGSFAQASSYLKSIRGQGEGADNIALLNYARSVFDVDENGNPRGAGTRKKSGQFYTADLGVKIMDGIYDGEVTQNQLTQAWLDGYLPDAKYESFSKLLKTHDFEKKEIFGFIKDEALKRYPKDKATRDEFIDYYSALSKDKKLPDVITMVTNGQKVVGKGLFDGIKKQESWKADLDHQDKNNKLWGTYTNQLGVKTRLLIEEDLAAYYKTRTLNANLLADFNNKIGGLNSDTISAIKFLVSHNVSITPEEVNSVIKQAKAKENKQKAKEKAQKDKERQEFWLGTKW